MLYNLFISYKAGKYNLFGLTSHKLQKVIQAYLNGEKNITISGTRWITEDISSLRIFQHDIERTVKEASEYYLGNVNFRVRAFSHFYLPPETLAMMGREVTELFIQDKEYGQDRSAKNNEIDLIKRYVNEGRLNELRAITNTNFDFCKLIKLCEELDDNYSRGNYLSVGMIGRTILNHVPPLFGFKNFDEIASNYGGPKEHRSFKKNMLHLSESLKNIADSFLHLQIRKTETLPNETQVDFKQDMDLLLAEVIRICK